MQWNTQRALRPYAIAGIAILGAGSFIAFAPITPPLPDVEVPAIELTSGAGLGDFDIYTLLDALTGAGGAQLSLQSH
jgi:hypothetical protein